MTSLKYTKKFKQLFEEAENQFSSAMNTKMPGKNEQSDLLVSPAIEHNATEHEQEEKAALTAKAMEKVKQSLEVSDELQSILNRIDKINKDVNANRWTLNDKDNTAYLPSKNAQIFKQNNYLCLSYDDKVELFTSVGELHDFLRKHNIPLPENIKLHEAAIKPGPGAFKQLWSQYLANNYPDEVLTQADLDARNEKAFKPMTKMSREQYTQAMRNPDELGVIRDKETGKLQVYDVSTGGMKNITPNKETPKKECGATVGGSIGSAVQYTGKRLDEKDLQEVTPADRGWKPGIVSDNNLNLIRGGTPDPKNPNERDWSSTPVPGSRADIIAPLWFKWVSDSSDGIIKFYPERDSSFEDNAMNYLRTKHGATTRSQRETSEWKDFWKKYMDTDAWEDQDKTIPNPEYGKVTMTRDELLNMADDFAAKGYGNLLHGLDRNDPDLVNKFHPLGILRPGKAKDRGTQFILPGENPNDPLSDRLYQATIDPQVRAKWYDAKKRHGKISPEDKLLDYLAKQKNVSAKDYLDQVLSTGTDHFGGKRNPKAFENKPKKVSLSPMNLEKVKLAPGVQSFADIFGKKEPEVNYGSEDTKDFANDPALMKMYNSWKKQLADPNYLADKVIANIQTAKDMYADTPKAWNAMIDALVKEADTNRDIDLSDENLATLTNDSKLKETASLGKAFLNLRKQQKDVPLKEDDSPADFATGQSAIASDMSNAVDAASGTDTTATTTDMNTGDYAADPNAGTGAPFNNTPGFGDINIGTGSGDYSPDDPAQAPVPMPDAPEYKIVDVLVDENNPTKLKVRVKNKDTGKIETKDLSEIDV